MPKTKEKKRKTKMFKDFKFRNFIGLFSNDIMAVKVLIWFRNSFLGK